MATTSTEVTTTIGTTSTFTTQPTTTKEPDCRWNGCPGHEECCQKVCNKGSYYAWWCRFECVTCKPQYPNVYDHVYPQTPVYNNVYEKKVVVIEKPAVYKEVYGQVYPPTPSYGHVYGSVYPPTPSYQVVYGQVYEKAYPGPYAEKQKMA